MVYLKSIAIASLVAVASAHQNIHEVFVNGVSVGYEIGIRKAPSNNPVESVASNDLVCNVGGTSGAGVKTLEIKAGDSITVAWDQSTHPGPITHFLHGPVASASTATGLGEWAKIDELNYVDGKWANEIMSAKGMKHTFTIPTGVASGEYLLRSEMLALHGSRTLGGAQFYIGCVQVKITNPSGGGACSPKITLPGNYKASDPNIYIPDFYYGFVPATYKAPGGPVATCGSGGSTPVTTSRAVTTTAAPIPTTTSVRVTTTLLTTTVRTTTTSARPATTSASSGGVGAPLYGQCGGQGWTGPTTCAQGRCVANGQYYSQCVN